MVASWLTIYITALLRRPVDNAGEYQQYPDYDYTTKQLQGKINGFPKIAV